MQVVACGQSEKGKKTVKEDIFIAKPIGVIHHISLPYGTANIKYAC